MGKFIKFQKMKSQKGVILSLGAYPFLILLVAFSLGTFISSVNTNNQARIHLRAMQAQYEALKGIEYVYVEVKNKLSSGTPFVTHRVDPDADNFLLSLDSNSTPPLSSPSIPGTTITNGTYQINDGSPNGFEAKIYMKDTNIYILAKGKYNGRNIILVTKMARSSLYDYFFFFPGNTAFSNETLDASGGKIHTNGDIQFFENVKISNAKELTAAGKMYLGYVQHILPVDESKYPTSHYPWWTPPASASNVYRNLPDGHYPGDRYGLYMEDTSTLITDFVLWDGQAAHPPIPVSIEDRQGPVAGAPAGTVWAPREPMDYSYIYQQKPDNINCANNTPSTCANGTANNANYNPLLPNINGYYIPNRIAGAPSYSVPKYRGYSDPTVEVNLTNSEEQADKWGEFINSILMEQPDANTVKGLGGAIKAGASYLNPPRIDIDGLIAAAKTSDGMTLKKKDNGSVDITINGTTINLTDLSSFGCPDHDVFTKKTFMNHETALKNEAVEVDIGALKACEEVEAGKWIPKNNLLYSDYGIVLANARTLPDKGLTSIIKGNLYLKGEFNTIQDIDPNLWKPAAAIVSDYSYLLSDGFDYPQTLPHQQRHPEYPNQGTYGGYTIPQGTSVYDYVSGVPNGFNWQSSHDGSMAHKVTAPAGNPSSTTYQYNISLIGKNAYNPRFLERWNYYADPGNNNTPPVESSWKEYNALVQGAFIQLSNEFPEVNPLSSPVNARNCDSLISGITAIDVNGTPYPGTYPCRGTDNYFPDGLLVWYNNEVKKYESNFLSQSLRPPGYLLGLSQFVIIEVPDTSSNWDYHNNSIFPLQLTPGA